VPSQPIVREERILTELAFNRLLEWLDDRVDSQGETYLEIRRRLVAYFDRRDRRFPDELADETLNRVARILEKGGTIAVSPPARYCYVVAKYVLLEDVRRERAHVHLDEQRAADVLPHGARAPLFDEEAAIREQRFECLDRCLQQLKPEQRELVVEYYRDTRREKIERRREMARRLGISMNALAIRACRIRRELEACVEACRKENWKP
jgi:DNA-directed RNA polymerase specialized sigma24 family protein